MKKIGGLMFWGLIIAGIILLIAICILIWMIVTSNKLVVLKKGVDRYFPLINSKIRQYCDVVDKTIKYLERKLEKKTPASKNLKKLNDDCLNANGTMNKIICHRILAEKTKDFISFAKGKESVKSGRKINEFIKEINEIEEGFISTIQKYNESVDKYNKKRNSFPSSVIAKRFKFEEKHRWELV